MRNLTPYAPEPNMLADIHKALTGLPLEFRDRICIECDWSIPTYYRKMRTTLVQTKLSEKLQNRISNAEKEKILNVFDEELSKIQEYIQKYRK